MTCVLPIDQSEIKPFNPADAKARKARLWRLEKKSANIRINVDRDIQSQIGDEADYHDSMMIKEAPLPKPSILWPLPSDDIVAHYKLVFSTVAFDRPTVRQIVSEIARIHSVTVEEVFGPRRTKILVAARHHAFYAVASSRPDMSFPQIGRAMGGKDHTSVLHGIRMFERLHRLPTIDRVRGAHPVHLRYGQQG